MANNADEARRQCEMALRELSKVEKALREAAEMVSGVRLMVQEASDRSQRAVEDVGSSRLSSETLDELRARLNGHECGPSISRSRRSEP